MTEDNCNELEQVGKQGPYALLEAAVKRIDEKDQLIRKLQAELEEARRTITYTAPAIVVMDELPDEAPDTRDPDDYEDIQERFYRESWGIGDDE